MNMETKIRGLFCCTALLMSSSIQAQSQQSISFIGHATTSSTGAYTTEGEATLSSRNGDMNLQCSLYGQITGPGQTSRMLKIDHAAYCNDGSTLMMETNTIITGSIKQPCPLSFIEKTVIYGTAGPLNGWEGVAQINGVIACTDQPNTMVFTGTLLNTPTPQ